MDIRLIKRLVEQSFTSGDLDESKVRAIVDRISKTHLRVYIKELKKYIARNSVTVETAFEVNSETQKALSETYKNKKINYVINKDLLLGIKVYENDIIFSKNLKDTLDGIKDYINA